MGYAKDGRLKCDGWCGDSSAPQDCPYTVTHIDEKGYAYCTPCGIQRKHSHRCRKLTGAEIKRLQAGLTISYERPRRALDVWMWGVETFCTPASPGRDARQDLIDTIAAHLADTLDNEKIGTVTGPDGVEYQINVAVTLTPVLVDAKTG